MTAITISLCAMSFVVGVMLASAYWLAKLTAQQAGSADAWEEDSAALLRLLAENDRLTAELEQATKNDMPHGPDGKWMRK